MILFTHAIVGSATAFVLRKNPAVAVVAAFITHFFLDAVPHWHFRILSKESDPSSPFGEKMSFGIPFIKDIFRTGADFSAGLAVSVLFFGSPYGGNTLLAAAGALAGALPDLLQVVYYRFPGSAFLFRLQTFHEKVHAKTNFDGEPVKGITQQVLISAAAIAVALIVS